MGLKQEDIKQLIEILQRGLVEESEPSSENNEPEIFEKSYKKNNTKKNSTKNKFLDMPESKMHKSDTEIDKLLSKHGPVARTREYSPVSVICRVCGKKESVHPTLVLEGPARYKCNKCSSSEG